MPVRQRPQVQEVLRPVTERTFRRLTRALCARRLTDLTEQLSEVLMAAAICADEIRAILRTELDSHTAVR